ncbi:MAG: thiamine phosphate synthase [Bacteroidales bacterium]|nr:thiamine phosphate synthase [Bacteroidales bacterium]
MLQFITHSPTAEGTIAQARAAIAGGCRWVQVRMKDVSAQKTAYVLAALAALCMERNVTLIVDDHVELAGEPGVAGVHLGQTDMPVTEAREILGKGKIIGLTINSMDHARAMMNSEASEAVDYVGIGPWRFTGTKQRLAAVLGKTGVGEIIGYLRGAGYDKPIVVIGGVTGADVAEIAALDPIRMTGVAVSGAIAAATNRTAATQEIMKILKDYE